MADEHGIQTYFKRYFALDVGDPAMREEVLRYFVDKIFLYDDKLVVMSWYSEDNREVPMEVLNEETEDPFAEGEAEKFDCFPYAPPEFATANLRVRRFRLRRNRLDWLSILFRNEENRLQLCGL